MTRRLTADGERAGLRAEVEGLLRAGQPFVAYDVLATRGAPHAKDVRLRQLRALALARLGMPRPALEGLDSLRREGHVDVETLGLIGRVHKDLALAARTRAPRRAGIAASLRAYADAFRKFGGAWPAINAATMALLLGRGATARRFSRHAEAAVVRGRRAGADLPYWDLATLAEAALVRGETEEALARYARARASGEGKWGDLAATRRNLRLVLEGSGSEDLWPAFAAVMGVPPVAVCIGTSARTSRRAGDGLGPDEVPAVRRAMAAWIRRTGARCAYAGGAPGTDLLFLEAMRRAGGETHVVLPYEKEEFVRDQLRAGAGAAWARRLEVAVAHAARVHVAARHGLGADHPAHDYGASFLEGLARLHAPTWDAPIVRLAVTDRFPRDDASFLLHRWRAEGLPFDRIELARLQAHPAPRRGAGSARRPSGRRRRAVVRTALFGDAVGFSRLSQRGVRAFVVHVLGDVARAARPFRGAILQAETWGDGLFYLLDDVAAAGRMALAIAERASGSRWARFGLPSDLTLRIGLHTGPVEYALDPVVGRRRAYGPHLSHAARIEPVTPPGLVYASEAFAAIAVAEGAPGFACRFVGTVAWAKTYATLPLYRLESVPIARPRRSRAAAARR